MVKSIIHSKQITRQYRIVLEKKLQYRSYTFSYRHIKGLRFLNFRNVNVLRWSGVIMLEKDKGEEQDDFINVSACVSCVSVYYGQEYFHQMFSHQKMFFFFFLK